jgi:uncharacterized protein YdhG (YjbR/CyaY superfamily)
MRMNTQATAREYFAAVPAKPRAALIKIRQAIQAAAPGATLGMSYGMPTFRYRGRMLVCFAAFKNHCSFFPASYAVMTANKKELGRYEVSKGTIRFTPDQPLSATLVKRMVKARVREADARAAG